MLPHIHEFRPEQDAELFASVPAASAVFLLRGAEGEPYLSKSSNLRRRLMRLLSRPEERSRKLNLRDRVTRLEYARTGSDFESGFRLYQLLRREFPKTYRDRLRLRFPPLIRMHMENEFPRASVTTRIGRLSGKAIYYGPFLSRVSAEKFANDSLDFFKMRRCVEDLNPDPKFPGCIYSEMKMCLAPCFKGCTDDEYRAEVERVQAYFDSGGRSLERELSAQREQASAELAFENAAAIHARLEKIAGVTSQLPEIVRRLDRLSGVMVQPSAEAESVALFRIDGARLAGPATFSLKPQQETGKPQSMESRIQDTLAAMPPLPPPSAVEIMEHLAILKRWYYRTSKTGEIFFTDERDELPLRRIVRGVSRVFRGEKPAAEVVSPFVNIQTETS